MDMRLSFSTGTYCSKELRNCYVVTLRCSDLAGEAGRQFFATQVAILDEVMDCDDGRLVCFSAFKFVSSVLC